MLTKPARIRFNKYMFRRTILGKYILQVSWFCQDVDTATGEFVGDEYLQAWDANAFETLKGERVLNV